MENKQEQGLVVLGRDPLALLPNNGVELLVTRALATKQDFSKQKTDRSYVRKRQDFPYVPGSYMIDKFEEVIPLYDEQLISCEFKPEVLQVHVCLKITDLTTGNSRLGFGAARVQVSTDTKAAVQEGKRGLLPFDILDYDKQLKAARTNAKKDAIKEFGVCADIYDRIIVPDDVVKAWQAEFDELIEKHVTSPLDRMNWTKEWKANIEICKKKNRRDMFYYTLEALKKELNIQQGDINDDVQSEFDQ